MRKPKKINWFTQTWIEFLWLPIQMKIFVIGMVFLISLAVAVLIKHKDVKITNENRRHKPS